MKNEKGAKNWSKHKKVNLQQKNWKIIIKEFFFFINRKLMKKKNSTISLHTNYWWILPITVSSYFDVQVTVDRKMQKRLEMFHWPAAVISTLRLPCTTRQPAMASAASRETISAPSHRPIGNCPICLCCTNRLFIFSVP